MNFSMSTRSRRQKGPAVINLDPLLAKLNVISNTNPAVLRAAILKGLLKILGFLVVIYIITITIRAWMVSGGDLVEHNEFFDWPLRLLFPKR